MHVDEALDRLGGFRGRWQLVCFSFISSSMMIPACLFLLNFIFLGLVPPHRCKVPENVSLPVEWKNGEVVTSQCLMFAPNSTTNETVPCQNGWTYETDDIGWTIAAEFDLVCGREYLISVTQTLLVGGMAIGSVLVAPLPDEFGRKPVHLICIFLLCMTALATSFSYHFVSYAVLKVLTGIFIVGSLSALVMALELFPTSGRSKAGILIMVPWTFGMLLLLLLAYFLRDWRQLQMISALIPLIFLFGYWIYPESVPWLVAQGRYKAAEYILKLAANGNGIRMPRRILDVPEEPDKVEPKTWVQKVCSLDQRAKLAILFRSSLMRKHAGIMFCIWLCNALVYYGISFLSVTWAGNRFLNFLFNALVEIPAIVICLLTLQRFGRRLPIASFHILAGICLLITVLIPSKSGAVDLGPVIVTMNVLAKNFINSSFDGIWLYSPELFPTDLRSTGMGVVQCGARIGAMIAPFSMSIVSILMYTASYIPWLPGVIFSIVALICGLLTLFLPETFNKPLAQSLEEMEEYWPVDACLDVLKLCCKRLDLPPPEEEDSQSIHTEITHDNDSQISRSATSLANNKFASVETTI